MKTLPLDIRQRFSSVAVNAAKSGAGERGWNIKCDECDERYFIAAPAKGKHVGYATAALRLHTLKHIADRRYEPEGIDAALDIALKVLDAEKEFPGFREAALAFIDPQNKLPGLKDAFTKSINVLGHLTKEECIDIYKEAAKLPEVSGGYDTVEEEDRSILHEEVNNALNTFVVRRYKEPVLPINGNTISRRDNNGAMESGHKFDTVYFGSGRLHVPTPEELEEYRGVIATVFVQAANGRHALVKGSALLDQYC